MFHDFVDFIFPRLCSGCETCLSRNEKALFTRCLHFLLLTNYHLEKGNAVEAIFYGRIPPENATSLLLFEKKALVPKLIYNLKYKG